jgi:hypothetical protein
MKDFIVRGSMIDIEEDLTTVVLSAYNEASNEGWLDFTRADIKN